MLSQCYFVTKNTKFNSINYSNKKQQFSSELATIFETKFIYFFTLYF